MNHLLDMVQHIKTAGQLKILVLWFIELLISLALTFY